MNKEEFKDALRRNRMSYDEFSIIVGRSIRTVYEFGERTPVPFYARFALRVIDELGPDKTLKLAKMR
ncbi:MAG: hypothetical protein KZQ77_10900 [Candidatus Thiodiazotropha sp. (ex Notomyrtea botanica)]|nr:hypothetical protein [Candidatus Thiodiazotropha sp. (ex Notomyrtea botanica)]